MAPERRSCSSATVQIYTAGSLEIAKQVCREYVFDVGFCVNIRPTTYIYTGGEEEGVVVEIINYARFLSDNAVREKHAQRLAELLRIRLCQHSYSIVTPQHSTWVSYRSENR